MQDETEEALLWQKEQVAEAVESVWAHPDFDALRRAVRTYGGELLNSFLTATGVEVAGQWFHLGDNDTGTEQALRVTERGRGDGRVLVDAAARADQSEGRPISLLYFAPSPDGTRVAYTESTGGDMTGVRRVVEVAMGELADLEVPVLVFNLPRPCWLPDGSGFFVQGRAEDGRHRLRFVAVTDRAPAIETVTFGFEQVPATLTGLVAQVSPSGAVIAVTVPHEHVALMLGDLATGAWRPFAPAGFTGELHGDWLDDDTYVAIATDQPRGWVVAIPAATSADSTTWTELLPPGERVLRSLQVLPAHRALRRGATQDPQRQDPAVRAS